MQTCDSIKIDRCGFGFYRLIKQLITAYRAIHPSVAGDVAVWIIHIFIVHPPNESINGVYEHIHIHVHHFTPHSP